MCRQFSAPPPGRNADGGHAVVTAWPRAPIRALLVALSGAGVPDITGLLRGDSGEEAARLVLSPAAPQSHRRL